MLHVVHGDTHGDKADLNRAARTKRRLRTWVIPRRAVEGDELVIYVGKYFYATAIVASETRPRPDWKKSHRWGAAIRNVRLIQPPISLEVIQARLPAFAWARYPRSIVTAKPKDAAGIRRLIARRRRLGPADVPAEPQKASFEERYELAKAAAKPRLYPKMRTVSVRDRIKIIHDIVLERADGVCEGCDDDAPFFRPDGRWFLETHHTKEVAKDGADHPDVVMALCPNCHARVHHSADKILFNRTLIRKLSRIVRARFVN